MERQPALSDTAGDFRNRDRVLALRYVVLTHSYLHCVPVLSNLHCLAPDLHDYPVRYERLEGLLLQYMDHAGFRITRPYAFLLAPDT